MTDAEKQELDRHITGKYSLEDQELHDDEAPEIKEDGLCPHCKSDTGLKYPRGLKVYCEDCGWPDECLPIDPDDGCDVAPRTRGHDEV